MFFCVIQFLKIFVLCVWVFCLQGYLGITCMLRVCGGQKWTSCLLELKIQLSCRYWEWIMGPLLKKQVLLTTEPPGPTLPHIFRVIDRRISLFPSSETLSRHDVYLEQWPEPRDIRVVSSPHHTSWLRLPYSDLYFVIYSREFQQGLGRDKAFIP